MGQRAGGFGIGAKWGALAGVGLALCGCASNPATIYDLTAARPPAARPLRAQIRIAQPVATLDLDSERILVRETPLTLATLPGARWPESLASLFRARLVASFQNAGLARYLAGGGATADYELDLDIRAFEFEPQKSQVRVDVAARIVSVLTGRVAAVEIFTAAAPVTSPDAAGVAAALDQASTAMMSKLVAFVARSI